MGRKNKVKLLKHGSHSLNASSLGDSEGRLSSPENHVPEFEVLSSHLRELVTSPSTSDRHREMKYMFAALEKRDTELMVAKQLIRKLQGGASDHTGDGDSSLAAHDETYGDIQQSNEELDRTKKQNDELVEERDRLVSQLRDTEEYVQSLKDALVVLESNVEKTNKSLDEGQKTSSQIIQDLETLLKEAEAHANKLQAELNYRQSDYTEALKELSVEKAARLELNKLVEQSVQTKEETCIQLQKALDDMNSEKSIRMEQDKLISDSVRSKEEICLKLEQALENLNAEKTARLEQNELINQISKSNEETSLQLQKALESRDQACSKLQHALDDLCTEKAARTDQDKLLSQYDQIKDETIIKLQRVVEELETERATRSELEDRLDQFAHTEKEISTKLRVALDELNAEKAARLEQDELISRTVQTKDEASIELQQALKDLSTEKAARLEQEGVIDQCVQTKYEISKKLQQALDELNFEKSARLEQDNIISQAVQAKDDACLKLQQALDDLDASKETVGVLSAEIEQKQNERSMVIQQLIVDREKLESRYENINNGVQLIKKDFDSVKKGLIQMKDKNEDLQKQLAASKADVKHYRDDGEACRAYIKKLEAKMVVVDNNAEKIIKKIREEYNQQHAMLLNSARSYGDLYKKLSEEFQGQHEPTAILDSVKKLKESFRLEQRKQVFNLAAIEAKEAAHQKLLQQHETFMESVKKVVNMKAEQMQMIEEEKQKLSEELASAKNFVKKVRKEKDNALKKLKRLVTEKTELLEQNKSFEEKLNISTASCSNESMNSQNSESVESLEQAIKILKSHLEDSDEKLAQVTQELMNKEDELLALRSALDVKKSKCDENQQELESIQKTISMLQSRHAELQLSCNEWQKRYNEEVPMYQQKLESAETALKEQEQLAAKSIVCLESSKQESGSEKRQLLEEIEQLRTAISTCESERAQFEELVSSTEEEKLQIVEKSISLESQLESVQNALGEQEKSNQQIKHEMQQLREALITAEVQKKDSLDEQAKIALKLVEAERSQIEKEVKLTKEVDSFRTQIMKQDVEIEKLSVDVTLSAQALDDMSQVIDQKKAEYEKALESEKAKCEILGKKLEEKTAESSDKMKRLKAKEVKLEEMKVDFEKKSDELKEKIKSQETELAKAVADKISINSEVDDYKNLVAEKDAEIVKLTEQKSDLDSKQELLQKEVDVINRKLEDALSPKKDKVVQLENRLEVMQTASKAQYKRIEEELASARASLQQSSEVIQNQEKIISDLQQRAALVDELSASHKVLSEELEKTAQLKEVVSELEKQNSDILYENAEERAGLVNELIDAKQKLAECEKQIRSLQDALKSNTPESQSMDVVLQADPEQKRAIDEMFPSMDPAVRQLVILLSENRNYSYGVLGLVIYGFLVHLYILFN